MSDHGIVIIIIIIVVVVVVVIVVVATPPSGNDVCVFRGARGPRGRSGRQTSERVPYLVVSNHGIVVVIVAHASCPFQG